MKINILLLLIAMVHSSTYSYGQQIDGARQLPVQGKLTNRPDTLIFGAAMDEVVVIGYGQRSRREVTTAISSISSEAIEQTVSMTPEMAMQGRMAGVQVFGNTGDPMMRPSIRIRGVNTWGISAPLYVIDGMPVTEFG